MPFSKHDTIITIVSYYANTFLKKSFKNIRKVRFHRIKNFLNIFAKRQLKRKIKGTINHLYIYLFLYIQGKRKKDVINIYIYKYTLIKTKLVMNALK